jgi:hypothetical protein
MASETTLGAAELEVLDRLARRVVELRMEVPAILALETGKPLSVLAGQTLVFFEPIAQSLFPWSDYRRFAALIERREAVEALIQRIERRADEARPARRGREPRPPQGPPSS